MFIFQELRISMCFFVYSQSSVNNLHVLPVVIFSSTFLNISAALDIILSWKAWGNMQSTQIIRYLLKLVVAAVWLIILPIGYSGSMQNPTGLVKFFSSWFGNLRNQTFFSFAIAIYLIPNIVSALLFMLPLLQRKMERSNWRIIIFFLWWSRASIKFFESLIDWVSFTVISFDDVLFYSQNYMLEGACMRIWSRLWGKLMMASIFYYFEAEISTDQNIYLKWENRYTLFWILLLISKLAFSYYIEVLYISPAWMIDLFCF